MKEIKKQIQIYFVLVVIITLIIFVFTMFFKDFKLEEIFINILIGSFSGVIIGLLIAIVLYRLEVSKGLNKTLLEVKALYGVSIFIEGVANEFIENIDNVGSSIFLKRFYDTIIQFNNTVTLSNNNIAMINMDSFFQSGKIKNIYEEVKKIQYHSKDLNKKINDFKLLFSELELIDAQINLQKSLTYDLIIFEEKRQEILSRIKREIIAIITLNERLKISSFNTLDEFIKYNFNKEEISQTFNIRYNKTPLYEYSLVFNEMNITNTLSQVIDYLGFNKIDPILSNILLLDVCTKVQAVSNELKLVEKKYKKELVFFENLEKKMSNIRDIYFIFNRKYSGYNWDIYFNQKGLNYVKDVRFSEQPNRGDLISALNEIEEIKRMEILVNEINSMLNTNPILKRYLQSK